MDSQIFIVIMNNLTELTEKQQLDIYALAHDKTGISQIVLEKDWWVTAVLRALFSLPYSEYLSFKGGTSLSKCYNLIERFSEDIDIAISRDFLGYGGKLSKTQINDKLRRAACSFVREKLQFDLAKELEINGISPANFSIKVNITPITTTDPEIIEIHYKTLFSDLYIKPVVKLEISGRSMNEPVKEIALQSTLDEVYPNTPVAEKALSDKELYNFIVEHRRVFVGLKGFDYSTLAPKTISIVPPNYIIDLWKTDYETMQRTMIYGNSLPFNKLIDKIKQMNERINQIDW